MLHQYTCIVQRAAVVRQLVAVLRVRCRYGVVGCCLARRVARRGSYLEGSRTMIDSGRGQSTTRLGVLTRSVCRRCRAGSERSQRREVFVKQVDGNKRGFILWGVREVFTQYGVWGL